MAQHNAVNTSPESSYSAKERVPSARHVGGKRHAARRDPASVLSELTAK